VGVMHRIDELADRPEGFKPKNVPKSLHLIPLSEIIADVLGTAKFSKKVQEEYEKIVAHFGGEINVLLDAQKEEIAKITLSEIAENIEKMRKGEVERVPGFDGVYGKITISKNNLQTADESENLEQQSLF